MSESQQTQTQPKFYPSAPWQCVSGEFKDDGLISWEILFPEGERFVGKGVADIISATPLMYEALVEIRNALVQMEIETPFGSPLMYAVLKSNTAIAKAEGSAK